MYNITFQQLETFFAVAERLNISETANAMYISQSALSKTIHRLEEGLGLQLFLRSNRGLMLTKEGEYLYSELRPPYNTMCKNVTNAKKMVETKVLRIGYPSTYDSSEDYDKLKQLIKDFSARHPETELAEVLYDFSQLKHVLLYGDVDIAFSHDFISLDSPHISRKNVCRSRMCLAMSVNHPLAVYSSIDEFDIRKLDGEVFFIQEINDEVSDKERAISNLSDYGIKPKEIRYVANFNSLMRALSQGKGMSLCGYFPKAPNHEEIKYFDLTSLQNSPYLTAAWRSNNVSKQLQEFINLFPDDPEEMTVFK